MITIPNEAIFFVLRIIKRANPGDQYYEAYLGHLAKRKETFFDLYHFNWAWAIEHKPKKILEIGTRTGISLCQLLCAYIDHSQIESIVCCDLFNDGFISPGLVKYNLGRCGIPQTLIDKVVFCVGDSKTTLPSLEANGRYDYILVDGGHDIETASLDLENAYKLLESGGVIVFDDIGPDGCNLLPVWNTFKHNHRGELDFFENMEGKGLGWGVKK